MAGPPENRWWQSFGPFIETAVTSVGVLFGRIAWTSFFSARSEEMKEEKDDDRQRRKLLRSIDSRAEVELDRCWKRIDELNAENMRLRADNRLWEGRCRRADVGWHDLHHQISNERFGAPASPLPSIPKIEDPLS
jgi:predicted nuclease with TOPRIM domain